MKITLTSHQREVLVRIYKIGSRTGFYQPVDERDIGSRSALAHLMQKGFIEIVKVKRGPRGGTTRFFQPTERGVRSATRAITNEGKPSS
jgi:hypothetical protein